MNESVSSPPPRQAPRQKLSGAGCIGTNAPAAVVLGVKQSVKACVADACGVALPERKDSDSEDSDGWEQDMHESVVAAQPHKADGSSFLDEESAPGGAGEVRGDCVLQRKEWQWAAATTVPPASESPVLAAVLQLADRCCCRCSHRVGNMHVLWQSSGTDNPATGKQTRPKLHCVAGPHWTCTLLTALWAAGVAYYTFSTPMVALQVLSPLPLSVCPVLTV